MSKEDWNINRGDVQDFCNELDSKIMSVLHKLIPFKFVTSIDRTFNEPPNITRLRREKKNLLTNAKRRNNAELLNRRRKVGRRIREELWTKQHNSIRNKILYGGSAGLWQGMKMAMDRPQDSIPNKMENGETLVIGEEAVAHEFASFFKKKVEDIVETCQIENVNNNGQRVINKGNENFFTETLVKTTMENLKEKNSFGFDNVPQQILRDGVSILYKPYHKLLNIIYEEKQIPEQWKTLPIIPLYKKGNKAEISNYHPISNLCSATKVFEKAVLTRILGLADSDQLFSQN